MNRTPCRTSRRDDCAGNDPRGRRHAFTLVEMMIAIGIILFVAGLTISASSAVMRGADVRTTKETMRLLDVAVQEWEHAAGRSLIWSDDPGHGDVWSGRAFTLVISEVLDVIRRNERVAGILAGIDPDRIYTYAEGETPPWIPQDYFATTQLPEFIGSITVLDAWGSPIYATLPGAVLPPGTPGVDPDGTERTYNENHFGVVIARRVCFVSAGPDRSFGNLHLATDPSDHSEQQRREVAQAADNIYSYAIDLPHRGD